MSWTSKITEVVKNDNGRLDVKVALTNGERVVKCEFSANGAVDALWLKKNVTAKISDLTALDTLAESISIGDFDPVFKIPDSSAEELAFQEYQRDTLVLRKMEALIASGVKLSGDQDYVNLLEKVKSEFKTEYI